MKELIDKRTKEHRFIIERIKAIQSPINRQSVINIGYHPIMTGLRIKDVEFIHTFNNN
jgi:hypothetical protein